MKAPVNYDLLTSIAHLCNSLTISLWDRRWGYDSQWDRRLGLQSEEMSLFEAPDACPKDYNYVSCHRVR